MKYIYFLTDPVTNEIRYIGQTSFKLKRRLYSHIRDASNTNINTHKTKWINKLKRQGYNPVIKVLQFFENISNEDLNNAEIYWIKHFKELGNNLTNSTDGGSGLKGYIASEETCRKISESNRGKKHSEETKRKLAEMFRGSKLSDQTKQKISLTCKGRKTFLGKKHTEETKQKISKARSGQKQTEEHVRNNKLAQLARFLKKRE